MLQIQLITNGGRPNCGDHAEASENSTVGAK